MEYKSGVEMCAVSLMMRYRLLNDKLSYLNISKEDNVNVFINFESIIDNLFHQRESVSTAKQFRKEFTIEIESTILNLVGHYKEYFKNKCNKVCVYLYYTHIQTEFYEMSCYNEYYRNCYKRVYGGNTRMIELIDVLNNAIIPDVELILRYIPNCYFMRSTVFDGSVIPHIVSTFSECKNIIITSDIFDTLYMFQENFTVLYILKDRTPLMSPNEVVQTIITFKSAFDLFIFNNKLYYKILLSVIGNRIRSINPVMGLNPRILVRILNNKLDQEEILPTFESIDSIINIFPLSSREELYSSYNCINLDNHINMITDADIEYVKSLIIDKEDNISVEALNNKRFIDNPINLDYLLE